MNATDWVVIAGAGAAIAWVNWYFFLADRAVAAEPLGRGSQGRQIRRPEAGRPEGRGAGARR